MFNRNDFRALDPASRTSRLKEVNRVLQSAGMREIFRRAAQFIVAHLYPDLNHWHEPFHQMNGVLREFGLQPVRSVNTFARFLNGTTKAPRGLQLSYLLVFCLDLSEKQTRATGHGTSFNEIDTQTKKIFSRLGTYLTTGDASLLPDVSSINTFNGIPHPTGAIEALFGLFRNHDDLQNDLYGYFFWPSQSTHADEDNEAYYLCYRYSTVHGSIVKSFLVVKTPKRNKIRRFSFLHIIHGGATHGGAAGNPAIRKQSRGYILSFPVACYLLGRAERTSWGGTTDTAETVDCLAVEYEHLRSQRACVPALTLAAAAGSQPVTGRVALVRLGDRVAFGKALTDDIVIPTELDKEQLKPDLERVFERMKRAGFDLDATHITAASGYTFVHQYINNVPLWEIASSNPSAKARNIRMEGALEAWRNGMRE